MVAASGGLVSPQHPMPRYCFCKICNLNLALELAKGKGSALPKRADFGARPPKVKHIRGAVKRRQGLILSI